MTAFFAEYGLFLLKVVTIVIAIVVVIAVAAASGRKAAHEGLEVESINKKYRTLAGELRKAVLQKASARKKRRKKRSAPRRRRKRLSPGHAVL
jgi:serine protease SohB